MGDSSAISVQNVSKKYRLYNSPKERLWEAFHPFGKNYHKEFWALKEVSFDVPKGTTLGIIGRNGSGKSTLLQIICSVLRPTSGEAKVRGRISPLLELGAGFNPEFTGRENVILNSALMGFSRQEIKERLPQIETFADIGEFIDQPVKVYSSGMFARLAFAAAINVDPEILVVDEALAVGDAKFQHKCFQKFHEFQNAGKTIIFVSHDIHAVVKHCNQALLIDRGTLVSHGNPNDVVNRYVDLLEGKSDPKGPSPAESAKGSGNLLSDSEGTAESNAVKSFLSEIPEYDLCPQRKTYNKKEYRFGNQHAEILDYLLICGDDIDPTTLFSGDSIHIYMKVKFHQAVEVPSFGFSIKSVDGITIYACNTRNKNTALSPAQESDVIIMKFTVKMDLHFGDYFIDLGSGEKSPEGFVAVDRRYSLIHLQVKETHAFDGFVELNTTIEQLSVTHTANNP